MSLPRVFVSFATTNISRQEAELGQQLIDDLYDRGVEVVTDDESIPDSQFMQFLQQELVRCQWLILIQTAEAARSLRVQVTMNTAQQQVAQGNMRGMLRILCSSSKESGDIEHYTEVTVFPYSGDYPRIRDKILLALDLLLVDDVIEKNIYKAPTISLPMETDAPISAQKRTPSRKDVPAFPLEDTTKKRLAPTVQPIKQGDRPIVRPGLARKKRFFLACSLFILFVMLLIIVLNATKGPSSRGITPTVRVRSAASMPAKTTNAPVVTRPVTTNGAPLLAQDSFQRADQPLWGTASDGQLWAGDANNSPAFSIKGKSGQIISTTNTATLNALLGPVSTNVEVTMTVSVNHFLATENLANIGVALRWQDQNNWYKALIDGTHFSIVKHINGLPSTPASIPFPAQDGVAYTLLFRATGTLFQAKVWLASTTEPAGWMLSMNDASLSTGKSGIRALMQPNIQINITMFKAIAA